MTNTFAAQNLQWVGLAPETTYGTPIATPAYWVPADSPAYTTPYQLIVDNALRGFMGAEYQQVKGLRYDQLTFKTYFYLDSIYYLVRSALGLPDVVTGSSAPYTHKTSLQSGNGGQPQSSTVFWTDGAGKTWQMPGAQISDLKITIADGAAGVAEVTWIGLPATQITPPTNTPTTMVPMASWDSIITIGGTASTRYSSIELDIKRDTKMIPTITGTQSPFAIFSGACSVSGSFTGVYQGATVDPDVLANFANTQPALTVVTNPVGDAVHSIGFQLSKVAYDDVQISGNSWMEAKSTIKGLTNSTDVAGSGGMSPVLATLITTVSTAI
jgi:hypothetical protein